MFIPALISLVISIFVFNLGFTPGEVLFEKNYTEAKDQGRVLGANEGVFQINEENEIKEPVQNNLIVSNPKEIINKIGEVSSGAKSFYLNYGVEQIPKLPESDDRKMPVRTGKEELNIEAISGMVLDIESNRVLYGKNIGEKRSIASITKLMTALVFLDNNPGWEKEYEIRISDRREGGRIYLWQGEKVHVDDLFYLSLVGSANTATIALVNSTGMNEQEFVAKMNEKAREMGLKSTQFRDAVGLHSGNQSTAWELAKLLKEALSHEEIQKAVLTSQYEIETLAGRKETIYSTDHLLNNFENKNVEIMGGKTGYIDQAGFCFVGKFDNGEREIISIILGAEDVFSRFSETEELVRWTYNNYSWK